MLESSVVGKIKRVFQKIFPGCVVTKIHVTPRHNRGFPDLLIVTEKGVFFIEAKAPRQKPTPIQRATLKSFKSSGGNTVFCYWADCDRVDTNLLRFLDPETDEVVCTISTRSKDLWQSEYLLTGQQPPGTPETEEQDQ